jgi:hypothetical protein
MDKEKSKVPIFFDDIESVVEIRLSKFVEPEEASELESALHTFIPTHIQWLEEALLSLKDEEVSDSESLSKLIGSLHNLSLDFEELRDLFLTISDRLENNYPTKMD